MEEKMNTRFYLCALVAVYILSVPFCAYSQGPTRTMYLDDVNTFNKAFDEKNWSVCRGLISKWAGFAGESPQATEAAIEDTVWWLMERLRENTDKVDAAEKAEGPPAASIVIQGPTGNPQDILDPDKSRTDDLMTTITKIHTLPAWAQLDISALKLALGAFLSPPAPTSPGPVVAPSENLPQDEIERLRTMFLIENERHSHLVSNNNWKMALQVSLKWQEIGKVYPKTIDQITHGVAGKNGYPDFQSWIDHLVSEDLKNAK
jgi:hypothetical protein